MKRFIHYPRLAARKIKRALFGNEDIYSLNLLQSLLNNYPYLPMSATALRPLGIVLILNEIIINNRQTILEFGSGMSTILIARLIKRNQLTTQFISVEHDADFCRLIQAQLRAEAAPLRVQVIHAPLAPCDISMDGLEWFDRGTLNDCLETFDNFDMIIVDGPPSYDKEFQCGRYPALPFIWDKLKTDFVVLLDDAHRHGEKRIISQWEKLYPLKFQIVGDTIAIAYQGKQYMASPQPIDTAYW
jgi:predicted O-methyltransferase YrrM